jgi:hypothetical protein
VSYLDRGGRPGPEQGKRVDYRAVLSDADFAVFVKLRNLRKSMSEKDGLPAYTRFTPLKRASIDLEDVAERGNLVEAAYRAGTLDAARLQHAHDATVAITAHAETRAWFRARASERSGVDWRDQV